MPGSGELPAEQSALIVGREAGLARLRGLVDPVPQASQVLVVTGEAGMGKTVLLADTAERARAAGMRVLWVTGRESESRLAFAGLHQLLRPVLPAAAGLPGPQARALQGALGFSAGPGAADRLLTGVAMLTLLSDLSERSPVVVVADDAHWLDRSSLDVLAFTGSRLDTERVVLLVGARGQAPPPGFDRGFPELHLEPLSAADAGRLLDEQPRPPRGRAKAQVLAQAAGNPMALIELAKVIADDPGASRRWAAEPLPPTDRLTAVLASRFAALPEQTQTALLLAAVADSPDLNAAASRGAGPDARALAPLIPQEDAAASSELAKHFRMRGITLHLGRQCTKVEDSGSELTVHFGDGETVMADLMLVSVGRGPLVDGFGLEEIDVEFDRRTGIATDPRRRTTARHIYAVGDCAGHWQLAHTAFREGEVAARNACGHRAVVGNRAVPRPIYTEPEIASVGLTEEQARQQYGADVATGSFPWVANARAVMQNEHAGWVKSIHETRRGRMLGLVMVGPHVTDMVEAGVIAIDAGATIETVADGMAPHPTLSEAIRGAGLVALGRAIDVPNRNQLMASR
jgi:Pyridine nucleotide-disulphide oxidoreductase, dimerisation domain/Pyridine nucleotide-disulphide oxidoreductase/AAA ATPase domain